MKDNDIPAFPLKEALTCDNEGMTLREYFAGQALVGLLAHVVGVKDGGPEAYAKRAFEYADAMLAERAK